MTELFIRDFMTKRLLPLAAFLLSSGHLVSAADLPASAKAALEVYDREVAAAKVKAARQLQGVLEAETKKGDLDSALAVKAAIEELTGETQEAPAGKLTGKQVIKSTAADGLIIGSFKKGDKISLQYVEGRWAMSGDTSGDPLKWTNPDEMKEGPLSLGIYAIDEAGKRTLLTAVPASTAKKVFRYRFEKDCAKVSLRMMDSQASDNAGYVVYDLQ
ncbi:hypothetical protein [Luteolibacter soli]|uniref:Uncharacterized protein n=1 Tax=Luteolibacter soli TaxID=3135280 RepID=A0ABU9B2Q6_9BACT